MSVTVTTVDGGYDEPRKINFHNGFAWFLDAALEQLNDDRAPAKLFSQAIGPSAHIPPPGDLSPTQASAFADLLDDLTDQDLEAVMWNVVVDHPHKPTMTAAIATVREITALARYSVYHGGLAFR